MSIFSKLKPLTQQRIQSHAKGMDAFGFFNLLTGPELYDTVEDLLPKHRERLFPPTETLAMFLAQAMSTDCSCQNVVNQAAIQRIHDGLPACSTATGSYCRARQKLPTDMISTLVRHCGQLMDAQVPETWRWCGRPVRLIDGTTVSMPDTLANQATYPQQGGQQQGLGFPICRLVGVICLSSGAVLNAAMGKFRGKGASEQTLLRELLDTFETNDVVLGDAFYSTYFLLAELQARRVDAVFEQHGARRRTTDFRKGQSQGCKDHLIKLPKPKIKPDWMSRNDYDTAPASIALRELKVGHKVLITTLLSAKDAPKTALKALYEQRWHIEVDFRNIKTTLGMETFSCKTPKMNEKELWVYLLAYNLIRLLMAQAAVLSDILPRQLSFKHTLQIWMFWNHTQTGESLEQIEKLLMLIAKRRIGNRPGRVEPRAIKRRPKPFPLLMKPRAQAREDIRKSGHPKKLK